MQTELCCKEAEKSINEYLKENQKLIDDIIIIAGEIQCNIFGNVADIKKEEEALCLTQVVRNQNGKLREIADVLMVIRSTLLPR